MKIAVLAARQGWHTDELSRAITARGHEAVVLPYEAAVAKLGTTSNVQTALDAAGHDLLEVDGVLARIIPSGSLEQIIYRVDALHWLEDSGIPVMNSPRAI